MKWFIPLCYSEKEDEYAFLDAKPGRGRNNGGGGGRKGGAYRRRNNAGEALLYRDQAHRAYLIKNVDVGVGGGESMEGKCAASNGGGKKRLLSDHVADFNVSVPYSLNRKQRWRLMDDAAGCIVAQRDPRKDERVRLSVIESYFGHSTASNKGIRPGYILSKIKYL